jgi:hypothetical protein
MLIQQAGDMAGNAFQQVCSGSGWGMAPRKALWARGPRPPRPKAPEAKCPHVDEQAGAWQPLPRCCAGLRLRLRLGLAVKHYRFAAAVGMTHNPSVWVPHALNP